MLLQACPDDVVQLIIAEIGDPRALLSLSSTCRGLHTHADSQIYEKIDFVVNPHVYRRIPRNLIQLLHRTIVVHESPSAQYVHHLSIDDAFMPDVHTTVPLINEILERLPNLKSFTFAHTPLDASSSPNSPPWIFFPCMRLSPPPFMLRKFVWSHSILDFALFNDFLHRQPCLEELVIPAGNVQPQLPLPPDSLPNLSLLVINLEWLHIFPPGCIPALQIPLFSMIFFSPLPNPSHALSNLRAFGCPTEVPLLKLLKMPQNSDTRIMPKLQFVEMNSTSTLKASDSDRLIHEFSLRPVRYLRLPSQTTLQGLSLQDAVGLFSRIETLECVDYYPSFMIYEQWRRIVPPLADLLCPPSPRNLPEIMLTRWRRNATEAVTIALPHRRLHEWELDLKMDQ